MSKATILNYITEKSKLSDWIWTGGNSDNSYGCELKDLVQITDAESVYNMQNLDFRGI